MTTTIANLVINAHATAKRKGWYDGEINIPERLMMICDEAHEALHLYREGDIETDAFTEELADIIIRTCDLAGYLKRDLEVAVEEKMKKNQERPYRHGGKLA